MRRTVKIKLDITGEERELLDETVEQFKEACQMVVDEGWNDDDLKTYNKQKLHHATYYDIKDETDLTADLIVRARNRAADAIKGCVERLKQGEKASKPQFTSDSLALNKECCTVWLDEKRCSIATVNSRVHADFMIPEASDYYDRYLDNDWTVKQSTVEKHEYEDGQPYYLHLGLENDDPETQCLNPTVMGVDLGIDNLAVTSTGTFYSGDKLNHRRRRFEEIRGQLQGKGTQSAHRTIQQMSGRENRYACDTLHQLSKKLVKEAEQHDVDVIAFENLDKIRDNMPPQKQFHSWAFNQLFQYVEYKAKAQGITVEQVNPSTSQSSPVDCSRDVSSMEKPMPSNC